MLLLMQRKSTTSLTPTDYMQSRNPTTSRGGIFCCRLPYYTRRSAAGRFVGSGLDRSAGRQKIVSLPYCVCRGDHWSPANLPPQRIFRDSCLVRQAGTGEQCSPLQMFFDSLSPKYSCPPLVSLPHRLRAEPPPAEGAKRGARFCLLCVQADLFPLSPCQKPPYVVYYFSTSPQANPVQTGDAKL